MSTEIHRLTEATVPVAQADDAFGAGLPAGGRKPYAGTTGLGGSDASREVRAEADANGTSSARQRAVMSALSNSGALGMTIRELGQHLAVKPGDSTPSSVLSILHGSGDIARLATVRRNRQSVYVLPEFVNGRAVAKHGGRVRKGSLNMTPDEIRLVEQFVDRAKAQASDKPFAISSASAKALAAILSRSLGEVR